MDVDSLNYLAQRLDTVKSTELSSAAALVRRVSESKLPAVQQREAVHALFHAVWEHISAAIDHVDYAPEFEQLVDSLEAEMAGRVLNYRVQRGWLAGTKSAPSELKSIHAYF